jgi:transcriptional regulator with GAF, ATPase, and Fis domain
LSLVISRADRAETVSLTGRSVLSVGRGAGADIDLDDASVSRRHAQVHTGSPPRIEDLGSRNGTKINGRPIQPGSKHELHPGMVITLGDVLALVRPSAVAEEGGPALARKGASRPVPEAVVVASAAMRELYELIEVIGPSHLNVLILGETGVGKDVYAESVHANSDRAGKPFLRINCAALPESLLEAELFGYERGSFTGAVTAKPGLFEAADGGTVFLDEIGDMPLVTQAKLLRVLENGEVMRIGSLKPRRVDVRFLSATHRDLETLAAASEFRSDLFFRLNGVSVTIPPLRKRPDDIPHLVATFLAKSSTKHGPLSAAASHKLLSHKWFGNVRELKNVVERAALLSRGGEIGEGHVVFGAKKPDDDDPRLHGPPRESGSMPLAVVDGVASRGPMHEAMAELERKRILEAMKACSGNQSMAAERLGIARGTLIKRLKAYGYARPLKDRKG